MDYLMFTINWDKKQIVSHVGDLPNNIIKEIQANEDEELIVVQGNNMLIVQDPENINQPIKGH